MSKPTHVWIIEDQEFMTRYKPAGKHTRYKLVEDPEPDPPPRPKLVWFEYEGNTFFGMCHPDFRGVAYTVTPKFRGDRLLYVRDIEELGIQLRTDFAEDSE